MGKIVDAQGCVTPKRVEIELIQDFMPVLVTCKLDEDATKNKDAIVFTTFVQAPKGK